MKPDQERRDRMNEEFDAMLFHDAIEDYLDQSDEYEEALRDALSGPIYQLSDEHEAKMQKMISDLNGPKATIHKWPLRLAIAASFLIITASSMLVISDASIENFINFFTRREQTHTEVVLSENIKNIYLQVLQEKGWPHAYYPAYLPSHYGLEQIEASEYDCILFFTKGTSTLKIHQFEIVPENESLFHIDTENAKVVSVDINGLNGEYTQEDSYRSIHFSNGEFYFIVSSNQLSKNQLVKIAKNLNPLKSEK